MSRCGGDAVVMCWSCIYEANETVTSHRDLAARNGVFAVALGQK